MSAKSARARVPLLELNNASVVLGGARVLDSLTLTIHAGEHTAILGPNGAGKSTLMKLLTLQLYPAASADAAPPISVLGRERWNVFDLRSQMGIVSADLHDRFVHGNSNGALTGLEAVVSGFFATQGTFAHQHVTASMRDRSFQALERVGASELAGTTIDAMSTGEARRVLIARALVHEPMTLVFDEPTRGLDVVARRAFTERVREIARQGVTIVLVTHYLEEIIPEIDRVILLKRGRILADGAKAATLTAARLEEAFGAPLAIEQVDGYYHGR